MAAGFGIFALASLPLLLDVLSLGCTQDSSPPQHADSPLPDGTVRLRGGFTPYQGRVEIYHEDVWGMICDADWSTNNALVVCRQLGYGGVSRSGLEGFGQGTGPIFLEGLNCGGYEDGLADCPRTGWAGSPCGHAQDVGVTCNVDGDQATPAPSEIKDGSLRLVDGTYPHNGRVEVYYQGVWGTICRDSTDAEVPDVLCKQLGYESANPPAAVPLGGYGPGSGVNHLGHVICEGNEAKLAFCAHDKWGENDCTHADDVMVSCKTYTPPADGDLRLMAGGDLAQGQVEINYQGVWGTVCDTDWTIKDATVVCRQLGFQPARASLSYSYFLDEDSINPIFFDNVECEGSEAKLEDCVHSWRGGACQHFEDVGVICGAPLVFKPVTTEDGRVRLAGGTYPHNGRVEIKYQGEWGTVCDQGWNMEAANVVCRQLGYLSAESALSRAFFGEGSGVIYLDQVTCEGRESELAFCTHAKWGENQCDHGQDASVVCTAPLPDGATPDGSVRLVDGEPSHLDGRLLVLYQGVWGTVCGTTWLSINSDVACKQLGYLSARPDRPVYNASDHGSLSPIMLSEIVCSGNEERLVDCFHDGWAVTGCTHESDIGISCSDTGPTTPIPETTSRPVMTTVKPATASPTFDKSTSTTSSPPATHFGNKSDHNGDNAGGSGGHKGFVSSTTFGPVELMNDGPIKAAFPPMWVIVVLVLMVPAIIVIFVIGIYVKNRQHGSYKPIDHGAMPEHV